MCDGTLRQKPCFRGRSPILNGRDGWRKRGDDLRRAGHSVRDTNRVVQGRRKKSRVVVKKISWLRNGKYQARVNSLASAWG